MRVVLDTNVVISGFLWGGPPREIIDLAVDKRIRCFSSSAIFSELNRVIGYPGVVKRLSQIGHFPHDVIALYKEISEFAVSLMPVNAVISADPSDDKFLSTAVAAGADCIITGDHHLLDLKRFDEIDIVTPSDFLKLYFPRSR